MSGIICRFFASIKADSNNNQNENKEKKKGKGKKGKGDADIVEGQVNEQEQNSAEA